jgi:hypothetical protein
LQFLPAKLSSIQIASYVLRKMMETNSITNSVPIEPDRYVRKITKSQGLVILVLSIIACWAVPTLLPSIAQAVPDLAWLAFHVVYLSFLGVLFYRSFKSTKMVG